MKSVLLEKPARQALRRMPANWRDRIVEKLEQYAADPASLANNVSQLQGANAFRLRVGNWRIIFEEDEERILVLAIGPRGSIYER